MVSPSQVSADQPAAVELSLANIGDYLRGRGIIGPGVPVEFEPLSGGISNTVVKVILPDSCLVVKQSLPKLKVAEEWFFDRRRIFVERDCMAALGWLLPPGTAPTVKFSDDESFILGMSCAPPGGEVWKDALMSGRVDPVTAERAGRLLALLHDESAKRLDDLARFFDLNVLIQGRIDPYHRTVAGLHPELAPIIDREVERVLESQMVLVHGDYSPKNIVTYPSHLFILDFEVAHVGDPAFDVAFCLTHLVLKATAFPAQHAAYMSSALQFWRSYKADRAGTDATLNGGVVKELGCLLAARIDGKSKIEYITAEATKSFVRKVARDILLSSETDPEAVIEWLEGQTARHGHEL